MLNVHAQRVQHQPPWALHERSTSVLATIAAFALSLPIALAVLILLAELLLPSPADYAAFLLVPLLLATYCGGWKYGVALGWILAVVEQSIRYQQSGGTIAPIGVCLECRDLGYGGHTAGGAHLTRFLETQQLRESYLRLQTLQQTMVTVNDIVRNRLAVLLAVCDVLEEGRMPSTRQLARARAVIEEIVHLLDRLGRLEVVAIKEVAGVEAIDLDAQL